MAIQRKRVDYVLDFINAKRKLNINTVRWRLAVAIRERLQLLKRARLRGICGQSCLANLLFTTSN